MEERQLWDRLGANPLAMNTEQCGGHKRPHLQSWVLALPLCDTRRQWTPSSPPSSQATTLLHARTYNEFS